ncbi:ABC transporter substrate-binding protein [Rhodococcus sp. 3Y1]
MLLALGVKPVLSSSMVKESASQSYLLPYGAEDLDTFEFAMGGTLPVEAIAASEPDLIVAVGWADGLGGLSMGDYYERLSSIAPVVTSPDTKSRMLVPWKESIRVLGETLDLSKAAEKIVTDHDQYFAKVRQENPELTGLTATWAIFYGTGNGLQYLSAPGSAPATFLGELGFAENPRAQEFVTQSTVGEELREHRCGLPADRPQCRRQRGGFRQADRREALPSAGSGVLRSLGRPASSHRRRRRRSVGNHERWPDRNDVGG